MAGTSKVVEGIGTVALSEEVTGSERAGRISRIDEQRKRFASEPKVQVRVQEDTPVTINGYSFRIKGKTRVMVPESVAVVLEQAGLI